jgi:hypothetical protein
MEADYHNVYPARLRFNPECRAPEHRSGPLKPADGFEVQSIDATLGEILRAEIENREAEASGSVAETDKTSEQVETPAPEVTNNPAEANDDTPRLRVVNQRFITHLTCRDCGHRRAYVKLRVSLRNDGGYKCDRCGGEMIGAGFDTIDELDAARLSAPTASRTLRSVGIREGDVVCVGRPGGRRRYVVTRNGTHAAPVKNAG